MKINLSFYGLVIISLYIGYIEYLLLFLLALLVHELGHIMFIKLFNIKINNFNLTLYGGILKLDEKKYISLNNYKKFLIYIGGILFNLIFFILFKNNIFGKYNLLLLLFNLLFIYPLDGYHILCLFVNKTIINNLSIISMIILFIIGYYLNSLGVIIIILVLIFKNIEYFIKKDKIYLLNLINNLS